jgi:hypothetical protein
MLSRSLVGFSLLILFVTATPARADLIDLGNGIVYSQELGYSFLQDLNTAQTTGYDTDGRMGLYQAVDWIGHLNATSYMGYSDWELAGGPGWTVRTDGVSMLRSNFLEYLLPAISSTSIGMGPFVNLATGPILYWVSSVPVVCVPTACDGLTFGFPTFRDRVYDGWSVDTNAYVTAMRRGESVSVPEPATLLITAVGCALALRRRSAKAVRPPL